ncbi:nudix family hydrolase-like protein [Bisporella sp. PMI_857]|nr:nudix family hydrolase-like protein [Bisporella sp. PMI_857]
MAKNQPKAGQSPLIDNFRNILTDLTQNPYPYVENPPQCKKRASVALILRVRPHFDHPPPASTPLLDDTLSAPEQISKFFAQAWVNAGDPECIFIKRAARLGDRWTSHVALPGGKRDPEDEDDRATAIRETMEEIGLDLTEGSVISIGNLPERVISTTWGKVPLMVLCPFVFLYTRPDIPPVKLNPPEIASTHWVPLRVLLSPSVRTYEYVDVTDRFARHGGIVVKVLARSILGKMRFSAIRLIPSESVYCTSTVEFFSPPEAATQAPKTSIAARLYQRYLGDHAASADRSRPLLLWGLTLGILADFLDQLPPHSAVKLWSYPTFTTWDTRLIIHLLTINLKRRNLARLEGRNQTAIDSETEAVATSADNPWFIGGLSGGIKCKGKNAGKSYAVGVMLDGYYDMARRGAWITFFGRTVGSLVLVTYIVRRFVQWNH